MQQWVKLDTRGNWLDFREAKEGETRKESRRRNGANEYLAIDPDGNTAIEGGPLTEQLLAHDRAGNLTFDPLAKVAGSTGSECGTGIPPCGPGQEYAYDAEQRVWAIYRDTDNAVGPYFTSGAKVGQLSEPLVTEFVYDALGRRVETIDHVDAATGATLTTPKRTRHVYLGLETIQEYECGPDGYACDTGYVKSREFVWGDPDRFPEVAAMVRYMQEYHAVPPGEPPIPPTPHVDGVFHYLHDALGSVIGLVDAAGELVERYTYDPYGKVFIEKWDADANEGAGDWIASAEPTSGLPHSAVGNPWMWTGHRYDAAVGLYATLYRTYSPTLGRWLQRDPIEYESGSINLYEYVFSDPLGWIDPLGLAPTTPDKAQAAAALAAAKALKGLYDAQKRLRKLKKLKDIDPKKLREVEEAVVRERQKVENAIREVENVTHFDDAGRCKNLRNQAKKYDGENDEVVSRLKKEALDKAKETASKESGRHGEYKKRAAEDLNRQAKDYDVDDPLHEALKKAGKRLGDQGGSSGHPGGRRNP